MNKIHFFNSANFNYAEIDLRKKNIFFVGDNGSGKTTAIRAIQFFYSVDPRSLGIDSNKLSFKDFYFQYENSFIVYEFDDFFVFMYKKSGDIKKIFSKQNFDVNRLIKDGSVVSLNEAIEYVKEANLKTPANLTNDEYRSIIYGINKKYRDFKITTIKDYNTFVNLYNKIFNVNKSVFDANSIKKIIFTTIDRVEAGEIEYESFKDEIKKYRHYFKFYKAFKAQEESIEKLYATKEELLKLETTLATLLAKINYRKKFEEEFLEKLTKEIFEIEEKINNFYKLIGKFHRKEENVLKKLNKKISEIEFNLEEIKKLKNKFSLEKLQKAKRDVNLIEEVEEKLKEVVANLESLKREIKSIEESIEDEIRSLKRKIKSLEEEKNLKLLTLKREVEEIIEVKKEKIKEEISLKEEKLLEEKDVLTQKVDKKNEEKNDLLKEKEEIKDKFNKEILDLKEEFNQSIDEIDKKIKYLKKEKVKNSDKIDEFKRKIEKQQKLLNELIEEKKDEFFKAKERIKKDILNLEAILETKKGSFKEFLNENVDDWEVSLYPLIDEDLLSFSVEELKPKIISTPLIGLQVNTEKLKRIPTRKEAEEKIASLENKLDILQKEEIRVIENLNNEFLKEKNKIEAEIEFLKEENENIQKEILNLKSKKEYLSKELDEKIEDIKHKQRDEVRLIEANIIALENEIDYLKNSIKEINVKINLLKKELKEKINSLQKEKDNLFKQKSEVIEKEILKEKEKIKEKIKNLEEEKNKISKDERILNLEIEKRNLEEKLKYLYFQKRFLEEYEEKRDFIEKESVFIENLKICKKRKSNFERLVKKLTVSLEEKIAMLNRDKKNIEDKLEKVKSGLKNVNKIKKVTQESIESDEFLIDLISLFLEKDALFNEKLSTLKRLAERISFSLRKFLIEGLNVEFNFSLLEELDKNEFKKIDELYEFKRKKFAITNKSVSLDIKNLLGGILDKKLSSFEKAKDLFAKQVRKINEYLSEVDFGIVKDIKIVLQKDDESVLAIFESIRKEIDNILIMIDDSSLFFEKSKVDNGLKKIEDLFEKIKDRVSKEGFSIIDVVDIELEFVENAKKKKTKVISQESSTGGSILLKIAIAVSLLELFLKEESGMFLILDEVGVISTKNQKLLKDYVNSKGLGVIYVTPDLPLVDVEEIDVYKFRNINGTFEIIRLISEEGLKIE